MVPLVCITFSWWWSELFTILWSAVGGCFYMTQLRWHISSPSPKLYIFIISHGRMGGTPPLYQEQQGDKRISWSTFYLCHLCYWPMDILGHMSKNQSVWGLLNEWVDKDVNKWRLWLLQSTTGLQSISLSKIVASFLSSLSFFLSFLALFLPSFLNFSFYFIFWYTINLSGFFSDLILVCDLPCKFLFPLWLKY